MDTTLPEKKIHKCPSCGFPLSSRLRYCPDCHWDQRDSFRGPRAAKLRNALLVTLLAACLWLILWSLYQQYLAKMEQQRLETGGRPRLDATNPLHSLPKDALYAGLDLINNMEERLSVDPRNLEALRKMGDLTFERQVFDRSIDYYRRYLKENPADTGARVKYASALLLTGKGDKAQIHFKKALSAQPTNFNANANLALIYARTGNKVEALAAAETALKYAPSLEDRKRLEALMEDVRKGPVPAPDQIFGTSAMPTGNMSDYDKIVNVVWNHPLIGAKFVRAGLRTESRTLVLYFRELYWDSVPASAKEALFDALRAKVKAEGLTALRAVSFSDSATGTQMESVDVREP
jgi:tetratricopeptide (TPR) repeat protein